MIINQTGKIKFLIIDYTIASDYGRIIEKCNRDYQGPEKKLIIVSFLSNKLITLPNYGIPHRDNIEIYNAQEFADNIGYKGKYLSDYEYIRYLARKAFYNNKAYKELRKMSMNAKNKLNKLAIQYSLQPEDFQNFVYSKSLEYLIK